MESKAAVAFEAGKPLSIETIQVDDPRPGEVLVEIKAAGVCHTDAFTLSGDDPEGAFPAVLGHEAAGIVRRVGDGVRSVAPGDHVIPLYTPECRACKFCLSGKTNLCQAVRETQGRGVMPDGNSRFSLGKKPLLHYMGVSAFSNFTVLPEIAVAKIRQDAPFDLACYIGCGVTTGVGAVVNTAKVEPGANVVVFGLGGIGLNVVQGARMVGADKIIAVDLNPAREALARQFGATHFVNPKESGKDLVPHLIELTGGGADYSFECIGNTDDDAPSAGMLPQGMGRVNHHRRRPRRCGNCNPPVSVGHRPRLARNGLRRRARTNRCSENCGLVYGRQVEHRRPRNPPQAVVGNQRTVRHDAPRRIHSRRRRLRLRRTAR